VWALSAAVPPLVLVLGLVAAVVLASIDGPPWSFAIALVAGAIFTGVAVVWARMAWSRWRWSAGPESPDLRHGVVTARASLVPYFRIQQIDIVRDPLERMLGLSSLILRTASATSDAKIPGIPVALADALRMRLLTRAGGRRRCRLTSIRRQVPGARTR